MDEKIVRKFKRKRDRKVAVQERKDAVKTLFTPKIILRLLSIVLLIALLSITLGRELFLTGEGSLSSFVLLHFAGYLFFFLLPVEGLLPYYLSLDYSVYLLFFLSLVTAIFAEVIDYAIGRLAPRKVTEGLIGQRRYQKIQCFIEKYGGWIVFIFNLFPLSSSVVSVLAGVLQYPFWKWFLLSTVGLMLKYSFLLFVLVQLL